MNKKQLASKLVFFGGVAELLIATAHFLMPFAISQANEIASLPVTYRNAVIHATIAVGFCLMVFGALSIYFSQKGLVGEQSTWVFGLSQGILWMVRVASEIFLPIRIPLFFLANPTTVILPMVIVIALLFLVPAVILWPKRQGIT